MEKDIDRIAKSPDTDIVIRIDDYAGKRGLTIREFVRTDRYTGFTKAGTRIPADKFKLFKQAINSIDEKDLEVGESEGAGKQMPPAQSEQKTLEQKKQKKKQAELSNDEIVM